MNLVGTEKYGFMEGIENYINEMMNNAKGIISITIVSVADGNVLAYKSHDRDIDNRLSASFQIEVLRQITRGLNYVDDLRDKEIQDLIVTLNEQLHLIFTSESKQYVIHIISSTTDSNEGMIKLLHAKFKSKLGK